MTKRLISIALFLVQLTLIGQTNADDQRQIATVKASNDGTIQWTAAGETDKLPYVIEQFRWNKWIKIGEVDPHLSPGEKIYQFKAIPYYGENLCRVKPFGNSTESKEVKFTNSYMAKVKFSVNKKTEKIEFSDEQSRPTETMYEIIDSSGTLVKKGWGQSVSYDNLPKGKYTLNYDNTSGEFKR